MANKLEKCPLCDQDADFNVGYVVNMDSSVCAGKCERCGSVHVTEEVVRAFRETKKLHLLSALFRRSVGKLPLVTLENVNELIAGMPQLRTVTEKMNGLLKLLADSRLPPGTPITFDAHRDYPLVFGANWQEANFLLGQLSSRRFISLIGATANTQVTADGYERVEQLRLRHPNPPAMHS